MILKLKRPSWEGLLLCMGELVGLTANEGGNLAFVFKGKVFRAGIVHTGGLLSLHAFFMRT